MGAGMRVRSGPEAATAGSRGDGHRERAGPWAYIIRIQIYVRVCVCVGGGEGKERGLGGDGGDEEHGTIYTCRGV